MYVKELTFKDWVADLLRLWYRLYGEISTRETPKPNPIKLKKLGLCVVLPGETNKSSILSDSHTQA